MQERKAKVWKILKCYFTTMRTYCDMQAPHNTSVLHNMGLWIVCNIENMLDIETLLLMHFCWTAYELPMLHLHRLPTMPQEPVVIILSNHCVLLCPISRCAFILCLVCFVHMGNLWNKRIVGIGVCKQRTYWQQNFWYSEGRTPLFLKNVQAYAPVAINIGMKYLSSESNLWGLEWIIRWEVNGNQKHTTRIRTILGPHDRCLPVEHVLCHRT